MASKHRLIFLGTLLVGLTLFYFGVNTWMEQKAKENVPPPPIVIKEPQETKQQMQEQKRLETVGKPATQETKQVVKKTQKEETKVVKQKSETQKVDKQKQQKPSEKMKEEKVVKETEKKRKIAKKETMTQSKKVVRKLRTYVFQVGAFKSRENALRMVRIAKRKGFSARLVRKGELYKVYVYAKAPSYALAYKKVKRHFKEAFLVRN